MDLTGTWRAVVSDEANRRTFAEPQVDDAGWEPIAVPSHWRSTPAFVDCDGPLLYRTRFEAPRPEPGTRSWLVLDGLFYQGDVWLDGVYVGDTEGYFNRHTFEITEDLAAATEHVLGIEVTCAPPEDRAAKRNITGVFQHWDGIDPEWNPGGIWRAVRIETTGPVRTRSLRVVCVEATPERAVLACRAELDTDTARPVTLRTSVAGPGSQGGPLVVAQEDERPIAEGSNHVEWRVEVPQPSLWWPHALGPQPLHELTVEVLVDGEVSHRVGRRTGFRSLAWKRWTLSVNGEQLFLKGANLAPTRMALAEATDGELRRDIELAKDAGLDLVRVHGHVSRPELYRAADELGMLVWQDFPLQWGYARGIRKQARRQAAAMVDMLGHRPSIAMWCGHDEPAGEGSRLAVTLGQQLPTFNRTILDRSVKRAIERADPSRPVIVHSGVAPHVGGDGTDSHLAIDEVGELAGIARAFPRLVRFVGDIRGPSELVRDQMETLRRLKYRPTGGFCHVRLNDASPWPAADSVLDGDRRPKPGLETLLAACRPVLAMCEPPPAAVRAGETLALDVHVVSDLRTPIEGAEVEATVAWSGGSHTWRWGGDVPPDSCVPVGTITLVVPDAPGPLTIEITMADFVNTYTSTVSSS